MLVITSLYITNFLIFLVFLTRCEQFTRIAITKIRPKKNVEKYQPGRPIIPGFINYALIFDAGKERSEI